MTLPEYAHHHSAEVSKMIEEAKAGAFVSFVLFIIRQDGVLEAFRAETGRNWHPPKNILEKMVDDATGKTEEDCLAFLEWVAREHWGWDETPAFFREKIEARRKQEATHGTGS